MVLLLTVSLIAIHLLLAPALYAIAAKLRHPRPWFAFVPVLQWIMIFELSDDYSFPAALTLSLSLFLLAWMIANFFTAYPLGNKAAAAVGLIVFLAVLVFSLNKKRTVPGIATIFVMLLANAALKNTFRAEALVNLSAFILFISVVFFLLTNILLWARISAKCDRNKWCGLWSAVPLGVIPLSYYLAFSHQRRN